MTHTRIPVFCMVGFSGCGKTTLLEGLIRELKAAGLRVAAFKQSHHTVEVDRAGKDSWRMSQAGADVVVLSSPDKVAMFRKTGGQREEFDALLALVEGRVDLVLAEGFHHLPLPQVLVGRDATELSMFPLNGSLLATVSPDDTSPRDVPHFQRDDVSGLAAFLRGRLATEAGG